MLFAALQFVLLSLIRPCHAQEDGRLAQSADSARPEEHATDDGLVSGADEKKSESVSSRPDEKKRDDSFSLTRGGGRPITWPSHYRKFGWGDGLATGVFGAAAVTAAVIGPRLDGPRGGVLFDEDLRRATRPREFRGRLLAADLSDVFLGFSVTYGMIGDPLVNAGWLRSSKEVGQQILLLNLEVAAITIGAQQVTANTVGRERPYGRICGTEELDARTVNCEGDDRFRSFFSGHTSLSFSMAAATCTHHSFLPLAGQKPWISCVTGFTNAAATALLRVVADKHYGSDIIIGASFGSLVGWAVPYLHYATGTPPLSARWNDVQLMLVPRFGGVSIMGVMP